MPPHPEPPSHDPPHPIPLGCPTALALRALLHEQNSHWSSILHMVMYMFQCYSLKSSHPSLLPLSPKVCCLRLCLLFLIFSANCFIISGCFKPQIECFRQQTFISHNSGGCSVHDQSAGWFSSWWRPSSCLADGHFLFPQISRTAVMSLPFPIRTLIPWWRSYHHKLLLLLLLLSS